MIAVWVSVLSVQPVFSQELEPRSYTNLPIGLNFLVIGYGRTQGDVAPSPSAPIADAYLRMDAVGIGYARTFALLGSSAKFDIQTFRGCYDGTADINGVPSAAARCEWGDTRARVSWNVIGAPALDPKAFREQWKPGFTAGVSLQVEIPTGDYDANHILNAGTNRWLVRPGLGMSYVWDGWYIDASADVKLFQDNDNYLGNVVAQEPLYQLQAHLVRYFMPGAWISLNSNYYRGGESSRNLVDLDNGLDNARLGVTISLPLAPAHALRLSASTGVMTRIGSDFDTVGLSYQYRF